MKGDKTLLFIIGTTSLGGAPTHLYSLLSHLSSKYKKIVVCPDDGPYFEKISKLENTKVYSLKIRSRSVFFINIINIIKIILSEKVALIHSHGKGAGLYGRLCGFLTNKKVIHTFHGIHYHKDFKRLYNFSYLLYEKIMSRITSYFINVSNAENILADKLGIINKNSRVKIVYNAISTSNIRVNNNISLSDLLEKDISGDEFIVGTIANFYYAKGHEFLVQAAKLVINQNQNIKFLLIGDGPLKEHNIDLVKQLNIQDQVLFLGARENVYDFLDKMDVFVLCSRWEGMPISLIEAMHMGKPIVGTNVTGISELVEHNHNGLLVKPESAADIADALLYLINNRSEMEIMGTNSKGKSQRMFSMRKMVAEIESIYKEIT